MASLTIFNSESDEDSWVIQINQLVSETNLSILNKMPVCIYQVPKSLSCVKPEAFSPQLIAIGPYNHFRPELYSMERLKISSAKRVLDHFNKHDLKQLVEQLHNTGPFIRACYHKYLDLKEDTLLYTMTLDGLFLLDFFHNYLDEKVSSSFMTGIEEQIRISSVKLTKDAIIRDMIMVENQIPTYMLLRILVLQSSKPIDSVQEYLGSMLLSFCEKHSPLKLTHTPTCSEAVTKHYHILDLMYHLVVSEHEKLETPTPESEGMCKPNSNCSNTPTRSSKSEGIVTFLNKVKGLLTWTLATLKRLKVTNIPLPQPVKRPLDAILNMPTTFQKFSSSETPPSETEAPAVVVTFPSVRELHSVGIHFQPSKGGITTIEFDEKKGIFYLPVLKLDVNSEVIMRNLVAHEALSKPDFLIFTRYTELMRGIIDTVEDVKLLKNEGILESSSSLSVEETEELFNGMSKSIGPTKTEKLDETVKKVNKYFRDKQKAKPYRILNNYVYSSWRFLTLLATFVLLAMTILQSFCSVYDCPSHFRNR
ncbi:hypothetical protein JHK82_025308 [Glycine max]|nr:putative UPF0481 protein At3g02645 [Glycine max]XP_028180486.1 putative UPF0481 protein At3g02645 [Glycine soja]KAG4388357.1 hypothetical protein GLYMA_09G159900v4 [Glycine max]KAG5007394.1 hypothetical protein JHK85_025936 [Glycine max]KAG5013168.1 hypothetical protein JHK86_025429 [Glycine max]KAG5134120.1 hypothetical protein JHK82_025308 [Glycine max]KAH1233941.1 putative UPF0481 protein [Glycine max]|eukprot:XP_003533280.1 putative UPF0481 protein At3g02645 [Glycine max]